MVRTIRARAVRFALALVVLVVGLSGLVLIAGAGRAPGDADKASDPQVSIPADATAASPTITVGLMATTAPPPEVAAATPTTIQASTATTPTITPALPTAPAVLALSTPAEPATPSPVPAPPRIGLQAGHWRADELPEELARLRGASGGSGGGRQEWEVTLAVAEQAAERLRSFGYIVDVLPATIPPAYRADVFLSIHADASPSPAPRGFKVARSRWSRLPATDDQLVEILRTEYGAVTGLPWDDAITRNMTGYYAFNNRRRTYAIDKATPGAILEMGYLTNATDRAFLFNQTDLVVEGIVRSVQRFLEERPAPAEREQPAVAGPAIVIGASGATVRSAPRLDAPVMMVMEAGRRHEAPEIRGDWYGVWVVEQNQPGWVHASEADLIQLPLP